MNSCHTLNLAYKFQLLIGAICARLFILNSKYKQQKRLCISAGKPVVFQLRAGCPSKQKKSNDIDIKETFKPRPVQSDIIFIHIISLQFVIYKVSYEMDFDFLCFTCVCVANALVQLLVLVTQKRSECSWFPQEKKSQIRYQDI